MFRRVIISLLATLLAAAPLIAETAEKVDPRELKKKTVKTARKVDSFLQKRQARQNTDTDYIFRPQERWLIRTRGDISQSLIKFRSILTEDNQGYYFDLHSKPRYKQHFGFGYRGIVLGFGIGFTKKKSDKELAIKYYGNRFGGEVTFGYLGSLMGKFNLVGYEADIPEGDMDCNYIQIGAYYAFNGNRFSMPAAMNQSFIQRKSAGSPLVTTNFRFVLFGIQEDKDGDSLLNTRSLFVGLGGGYGYNWVPSDHWLLHVSATETLGVFGNTNFRSTLFPGQRVKANGRFIPLVTTGNVAVLYYFNKFYGGAFATVDNMFIPSKIKDSNERYRISTTRIQGHLTVGVRF